MIHEVKPFDPEEEERLLQEWFDTVSFDVESDGVLLPFIESEPDDEDDEIYGLKVLGLRAADLAVKARGRGWVTHPKATRRLHAYWTRGEGLAKWKTAAHPWTTLRRHLAKYVPARYLNEITTRWFHDVFGYYPGSDRHRVNKGKPPRGSRIGPG